MSASSTPTARATTTSSCRIPIPPTLQSYIKQHQAAKQTHLVWCRRRAIKNVRGSIVGLGARVGITENLRPHDFRRTYERLARRAGIDERTSRAVTGHSQGSDAHARYVVVPDEDLIEASKKIEEGLLERLLVIPDVPGKHCQDSANFSPV